MGEIINDLSEHNRTSFKNAKPFNHVVIDNFFKDSVASKIAAEFPMHNDPVWTVSYDNPLEVKKACSHWDKFPKSIYEAMYYLCSKEFVASIEHIVGRPQVHADYGMHGGGMHSHSQNGKLNIHKDYSLHPKIPYQRNYNLIVYMSPEWDSSWGGGLEFWSHDSETNLPKECITTVENKFNRAVIFDTTQNSWHGLPVEIRCPEETSRRSLAIYYLTDVDNRSEQRQRALYAPYGDQKNNSEIVEFCKKRSSL